MKRHHLCLFLGLLPWLQASVEDPSVYRQQFGFFIHSGPVAVGIPSRWNWSTILMNCHLAAITEGDMSPWVSRFPSANFLVHSLLPVLKRKFILGNWHGSAPCYLSYVFLPCIPSGCLFLIVLGLLSFGHFTLFGHPHSSPLSFIGHSSLPPATPHSPSKPHFSSSVSSSMSRYCQNPPEVLTLDSGLVWKACCWLRPSTGHSLPTLLTNYSYRSLIRWISIILSFNVQALPELLYQYQVGDS